MRPRLNDGWHCIQGYGVYIEDKAVIKGEIGGWDSVTVYPYSKNKDGSWKKLGRISVRAFSSGVRRGTIKMF